MIGFTVETYPDFAISENFKTMTGAQIYARIVSLSGQVVTISAGETLQEMWLNGHQFRYNLTNNDNARLNRAIEMFKSDDAFLTADNKEDIQKALELGERND